MDFISSNFKFRWKKLPSSLKFPRFSYSSLTKLNNSILMLCENELLKYSTIHETFERIEQKNDHIIKEGKCKLFVYNALVYCMNGNFDIFELDFESNDWTKCEFAKPLKPEWRKDYSSCLIDSKLVIYGGIHYTVHNDCYVFDLRDMEWNLIPFVKSPRLCEHSAVSYNGKMYIFGGCCGNELSSSFFEFDIDLETWNKIEITFKPPPMKNHSAIVWNDDMFVFGGRMMNLDISNHLYQFNFINQFWNKVEVDGDVPKARAWTSCIAINHEMYVLFGRITQRRPCADNWMLSLPPKRDIYYIFKEFFNNKMYSDIEIVIDGKIFAGHKCIISQSDELEKLMQRDRIQMEKGSEKILEFLYTGGIKEINSQITLLKMAKKFNLNHLLYLLAENLYLQMSQNFEIIFEYLKEGEDAFQVIEYCLNKNKSLKRLFKVQSKLIDPNDELLKNVKLFNSKKSWDSKILIDPNIFMLSHLAKIRQSGSFSDVTFISQDERTVTANKVVLVAFDEYFHNMFTSQFMESSSDKIEMESLSFKSLNILLDSIYQLNFKLPEDPKTLFDLFDFTRKTNNRELNIKVERKILRCTNADNVLDMIDWCVQYMVEGDILKKCKLLLKKKTIDNLVDIIIELKRENYLEQY